MKISKLEHLKQILESSSHWEILKKINYKDLTVIIYIDPNEFNKQFKSRFLIIVEQEEQLLFVLNQNIFDSIVNLDSTLLSKYYFNYFYLEFDLIRLMSEYVGFDLNSIQTTSPYYVDWFCSKIKDENEPKNLFLINQFLESTSYKVRGAVVKHIHRLLPEYMKKEILDKMVDYYKTLVIKDPELFLQQKLDIYNYVYPAIVQYGLNEHREKIVFEIAFDKMNLRDTLCFNAVKQALPLLSEEQILSFLDISQLDFKNCDYHNFYLNEVFLFAAINENHNILSHWKLRKWLEVNEKAISQLIANNPKHKEKIIKVIVDYKINIFETEKVNCKLDDEKTFNEIIIGGDDICEKYLNSNSEFIRLCMALYGSNNIKSKLINSDYNSDTVLLAIAQFGIEDHKWEVIKHIIDTPHSIQTYIDILKKGNLIHSQVKYLANMAIDQKLYYLLVEIIIYCGRKISGNNTEIIQSDILVTLKESTLLWEIIFKLEHIIENNFLEKNFSESDFKMIMNSICDFGSEDHKMYALNSDKLIRYSISNI